MTTGEQKDAAGVEMHQAIKDLKDLRISAWQKLTVLAEKDELHQKASLVDEPPSPHPYLRAVEADLALLHQQIVRLHQHLYEYDGVPPENAFEKAAQQ